MDKNRIVCTLLGLFILGSQALVAQTKGVAHNDEINTTKNISKILTCSSFSTGDGEFVQRAEPLGFIGDDYQRIHMKIISVIQQPNIKNMYLIYGKSMVNGTVCTFQGELQVMSVMLVDIKMDSDVESGYVIKGLYRLWEDPNQKSTGVFEGTYTGYATVVNGELSYNGEWFVADGFRNNQFKGKWSSYTTKGVKACNWGDYRIPDSGDLDCGTAEFAPSEKYCNEGWQSYFQALKLSNTSDLINNSTQNKLDKWWMDK